MKAIAPQRKTAPYPRPYLSVLKLIRLANSAAEIVAVFGGNIKPAFQHRVPLTAIFERTHFFCVERRRNPLTAGLIFPALFGEKLNEWGFLSLPIAWLSTWSRVSELNLIEMIKVENLSKEFGVKVAVDDVSFTVERGEILGFLGPNGAGKSTTMRMITGYIPPTAGVAVVGNHDIIENPIEAKRLIGYLPESAPLYTDMTVEGFLGFCAEVRGINGADKAKAIDRAMEMCFLEQVRHQSVDTLSKGYRHRTCFAQSIIHDPEILVMDEPTDGLDPNQKHEMRMLIRRMGQSKAIIFSTHILEEVEAACTRAIIIDQGKVVANGTPDELKNKSELAGSYVVSLNNSEAATVRDKLNTIVQAAKVTVINDKAPKITVRVFPKSKDSNGELGQAIFETASQNNWKISEIKKDEGRLDDVFREITLSE